MNNRILLIVFGICLLLFLGAKLIKGNKTSSFDDHIIKVDSVKVDRIKFITAGNHPEEFELKKNETGWIAVQGDKSVPATSKAVESILGQLSHLTAMRIVTRDVGRYNEYEITDSLASKVQVWEGKNQVADLEIGGFRFDQMTRSAFSFIKRANKPEVYEVDGFLSMGMKARFDQFRDKQLVKASIEYLTLLEWIGSNQSKQAISKEDGAWYYAGMEAVDSAKFNAYLNSLVSAQGNEFSELKSTAGLSTLEKLTLTGNNMTGPTVITAYASQDSLKPFLIASSVNPDAVFKSDSSGLYKRIFLDLRPFWPNGK
jgi:hypothetical protein